MKRSVYNKERYPIYFRINSATEDFFRETFGDAGISDAADAISANADNVSGIGSNLYNKWDSIYSPLATSIASQYGITPTDPAAAKQAAAINSATQQQIEGLQGQVAAGAAEQWNAATDANNRKMMAYGVNPNDARFVGANRAAAMGETVGAINAENQVPGTVRNQELTFLNSGSPLVGQALNAYNIANSGYNSAGQLDHLDDSNSAKIAGAAGSMLYALAFAYGGGHVHAPPGPPNKDTGMIGIRDGEYVLPTESVIAAGGSKALDDFVERTYGHRPGERYAIPVAPGLVQKYLKGYFDGGLVSDLGSDDGFSSLMDNTDISPLITSTTDNLDPSAFMGEIANVPDAAMDISSSENGLISSELMPPPPATGLVSAAIIGSPSDNGTMLGEPDEWTSILSPYADYQPENVMDSIGISANPIDNNLYDTEGDFPGLISSPWNSTDETSILSSPIDGYPMQNDTGTPEPFPTDGVGADGMPNDLNNPPSETGQTPSAKDKDSGNPDNIPNSNEHPGNARNDNQQGIPRHRTNSGTDHNSSGHSRVSSSNRYSRTIDSNNRRNNTSKSVPLDPRIGFMNSGEPGLQKIPIAGFYPQALPKISLQKEPRDPKIAKAIHVAGNNPSKRYNAVIRSLMGWPPE